MMLLCPEIHSHLGWRPASSFAFARRLALVPVAVAEIARVAQVLPVLFRKVEDRWQAVAVMGPIEGTNVFVSREGQWRTSFVPAVLRVYPFKLTGAGELALWEGYQPEPLAADGTQAFYNDGMLASRLQQTLTFLKTVYKGIGVAHCVLDRLEMAEVLTPWDVPGIETLQSEHVLKGLYTIDAARFEALEQALVLELFRGGSLRWLHAQLDSLDHAERFKALAKAIVAPEIIAPRQADKIEQAADILAAIAEDLGDAEL
ncbi:SapC family protein [Yoonia sp.]|nr:SapC family protein [Yoonia sp.]